MPEHEVDPLPFIALQDFWSEETRSHYCAGLSYRANTPQLHELVPTWVEEGKVRWGRRDTAMITGTGTVI